jgi:hypothetical protein
MKTPDWNDLLITNSMIEHNLTPEQLETAEYACDSTLTVLARGVSGIGNLLACTASNSESGLSAEVATDVGWLLESLGTLISNLANISDATNERCNALKREG